MDVQVPGPITKGLTLRGVTVLTAQEDGTDRLPDPDLLDRASQLGYVLVTLDKDFLVEAARRQAAAEPFAGVVYGPQQKLTIGQCVDDLELLAKLLYAQDVASRVEYLPL